MIKEGDKMTDKEKQQINALRESGVTVCSSVLFM